MDRIMDIVNQALPYIVLVLLFFFTLLIISYIYGVYKAKQADPSLRLSVNTLGKVTFGALYGVYIFLLIGTIITVIQIMNNADIASGDKLLTALNAINPLTIVSFVAVLEFQDIFFIGDKNIFIGNRMYEVRRMRKLSFPKRHVMVFVYGQKEYNYSTRFVDIQALKPKFTRMR